MSGAREGAERVRQSVPALGLVWADHVTCRLLLSRREDARAPSPQQGVQGWGENKAERDHEPVSRRQLEVVFAPHLPQAVVPLVITRSGITREQVDVQDFRTLLH